MSNTLADKLKAKAEGEIPALKLPEGTDIPSEEPVVTDEGFEDTVGETGQAGELRSITDVVNGPLSLMTALSEASNYTAPVGSYKALRLKRVVLPNGTKVEPNIYGYYENPTPDVEAELKYFAAQGAVELVTEEA